MYTCVRESVVTGLDWKRLFVQIPFMTLSMQLQVQVVYCVCYYFEEALQPRVSNPQKSCNSCKAGGGGCRLECTLC